MNAAASARPRARDRVAAAFVLALLAAGCLALWIAVPAGAMWTAGELTDSFALHMPLALVLTIAGMVVTGAGLLWLNTLYLRITLGATRGEEIRRSGPLEPLLISSLMLAIIAFAAWFLLLAENPALTT